MIDADIVVDDRVLRHSAAAKVADDFAEEFCIAPGDEAVPFRHEFNHHRRGGVERKLSIERREVRTLRDDHFIHFKFVTTARKISRLEP